MGTKANISVSLVISVLLFGLAGNALAGTIYVDANATLGGDGTTWGTAYKYLQDALHKPPSYGDEIWVAEGTYKPDEDQGGNVDPNDRTDTFQLVNGVALRGGYAGFGEPDPNARNIELYETILSGDLEGNDVDVNDPCDLLTEPTRGENSFHIVTGSGIDPNAVLDGFTISCGNANGDHPENKGGGIYLDSANPTITNCTISKNSASHGGGGMCNNYGSCPKLTGSTFTQNAASSYGGGLFTFNSSNPLLEECTFSRNDAYHGGGVAIDYCNPILTGCTFTENSAEIGGGVYCEGSSPTITNCTIIDNTADLGGGLCNCDGVIIDCTISGNTARLGGGLRYCDGSINSCVIIGNSADQAGGGLWSCSGQITGCVIAGNSANGDIGGTGGGLYHCHGAISNCTIIGNSSSTYGGGIYISDGPISNCIIWNNMAANQGNQLYDSNEPTYSCIESWSGEGEGNISVDPCFVEQGYWTDPCNTPGDITDDVWVQGNYHLQVGSPCIDSGNNNSVPADITDLDSDGNTTEAIPWDLDGHARFVDDPNTTDTGNGTPPIVDIGAYERGICGDADHPYPVMDFNYDCIVNMVDFSLFAGHWLECNKPECD